MKILAMKSLSRRVLKSLFDSYPHGVAVAEVGESVSGIVTHNSALETLTGYSQKDILGKHLLFLTGKAASQEALEEVERALETQTACSVFLVGCTSDGEAIYFDLDLSPIQDGKGKTTHFVGFYRPRQEVAATTSTPKIPVTRTEVELLVKNDKLTGIHSRQYFDELYERHWRIARRDQRPVSVFILEPDFFKEFTSSFGPAAVNGCLRQVARVIDGSFRRAGDVGARFTNHQFIASVIDLTAEQALEYGSAIARRIRELHIHHPKSPIAKHLTISVGIASALPTEGLDPWSIVDLAKGCLEDAQGLGHDRVCINSESTKDT